MKEEGNETRVSKKYLAPSIYSYPYWRLKSNIRFYKGVFCLFGHLQLKMHAVDGKMRMTDIADTGQLFRLIQSIPSPKAEPFKLWMAQVTRERLDEMQDPELTIDRAMMEYKRLGYSDNWINQRLKSIEVRKDLTDEPMTNREQNCAYTSFAEVRKRKAKPMEEERIVYYSPYTAVSYLVLER